MTDILDTDIAVIGAGTAGLTAFHEVRRAGRSALSFASVALHRCAPRPYPARMVAWVRPMEN